MTTGLHAEIQLARMTVGLLDMVQLGANGLNHVL